MVADITTLSVTSKYVRIVASNTSDTTMTMVRAALMVSVTAKKSQNPLRKRTQKKRKRLRIGATPTKKVRLQILFPYCSKVK